MIYFVWSITFKDEYEGPFMVDLNTAIEAEEWGDKGFGAVVSTDPDFISDIKVGQTVKFRNGEMCKIKEIRHNEGGYETVGTNMKKFTVQPSTIYIMEFDDGGTTIAQRDEFNV